MATTASKASILVLRLVGLVASDTCALAGSTAPRYYYIV